MNADGQTTEAPATETKEAHITRAGIDSSGAYVVLASGAQKRVSTDTLRRLVAAARAAGVAVAYHHYGAHDVWRFNGGQGVVVKRAPAATEKGPWAIGDRHFADVM